MQLSVRENVFVLVIFFDTWEISIANNHLRSHVTFRAARCRTVQPVFATQRHYITAVDWLAVHLSHGVNVIKYALEHEDQADEVITWAGHVYHWQFEVVQRIQ